MLLCGGFLKVLETINNKQETINKKQESRNKKKKASYIR